MEKINFSGGEPFLHDKGEFLGKLVQFCKQDLQLPSVSIVSNGSMIKEKWFQKYGKTKLDFFFFFFTILYTSWEHIFCLRRRKLPLFGTNANVM